MEAGIIATSKPVPVRRLAAAAALILGLAWSSWPTLHAMARRWMTDSRYSHGYLVPAFAAALLWMRRRELAGAVGRPGVGGLALVVAGVGLRLAGAYSYIEWFEAMALLPCLAGICVLVFGWGALRVAWPAIAFLAFMVPLPYRVEMALGWPLQRVATLASAYTLQTLGLPALAEGNIIELNEAKINIVEACSGLSMLLLFFALSTGVAMVIRRPLLDRLLLVAGAIPIALVSNVVRITVTGVLHELVGERFANIVFHDLAGWLMMPLALALLLLEMLLLSRLFVEAAAPAARPPIALAIPAAVAGGRSRPVGPARP